MMRPQDFLDQPERVVTAHFPFDELHQDRVVDAREILSDIELEGVSVPSREPLKSVNGGVRPLPLSRGV